MDEERKARHQNTLQEVLKFALQYQKDKEPDNQDALPETPKETEEERKAFLQNALKSMSMNVMEELQKAVYILTNEESTVEQKVESLNEVRDIAGNIDFANSFIMIGGGKVVGGTLKERDHKLKICSAYVIAELAQNNPKCQEHFLDKDVLRTLMEYTELSGDVASSAMHALSAIVRNYVSGCSMFVDMGGLTYIIKGLRSGHSNVFVKSCFLMRALSLEHDYVRKKITELGAVEILANALDPVNDFDIKAETILSALCVLTQFDEGKERLQKTKVHDVLRSNIDNNVKKAECEEIVRDSIALMEILQTK